MIELIEQEREGKLREINDRGFVGLTQLRSKTITKEGRKKEGKRRKYY